MSASFLSEVAPRVREALDSGTYDLGVPARASRTPSSLRRAIDRDRDAGALVVEYKRSSPGASTPLPPPRTVPEFVAATRAGGVAGYSCLATSYRFGGAPAQVAELVAATRRPVLFKEFVLSVRQLEVAARTGAAAVLLIARLASEPLLEAPLAVLSREAHRLGLEVLLELHAPAELSQVAGVEADVYGVNSRDLASLRIDRETAFATIEKAGELGLRPLLGLSGVGGPLDAEEFWSRGCDGLLVGSAVARSDAPSRLLASLRRPPPRSER